MRNFFADLWTQLKGIWTRLDGSQRLVVGAVMAAAVVGLSAMMWFAGRPSYEVVFAGSSADEVRDARKALSQAGVPFISDDSGMTILVDHSRLAVANAILVDGGLRTANAGGAGSGIASVMEDSETKAANLDDKRRGQAEQAIRGLDGVVQVSILATRPKRSPFRNRDEENKPRATVSLRLRPGTPFEAVARSAASMAGAQLGVPMPNVDVVDSITYQRWSYDPDREAGGGASEFLGLERSMSEQRTQLAQAKLDAVFPGKTIVTVNVELDPSWEIRTEKILPEQQLMKSDDSTKDETKAANATSGVDQGSGQGGDSRSTGSAPSTSKETRKREYVTDGVIGERRVGKQFPEVRRLTVAVLYDKEFVKDKVKKDDGSFNEAEFERMVKTLVGIDPGRLDGEGNPADQFSMLPSDFPAAVPEVVPSGPGIGDQALRWAPAVGQVLGVLLVLLFLRSLFKRARPAAAAEEQKAVSEENLSPDEQARRMRREIEKSIAADPAALAKLLESWLSEQKA